MPDRTGKGLRARDRAPLERTRNRDTDRAQALRALIGDQSVVYALRLADGTIKIGCSAKLWQRRNCFGPKAEILGFAPGDFADEQAIHDALKPHRARGHEYYHPTPQVLAVVNELRDTFGLPHVA